MGTQNVGQKPLSVTNECNSIRQPDINYFKTYLPQSPRRNPEIDSFTASINDRFIQTVFNYTWVEVVGC